MSKNPILDKSMMLSVEVIKVARKLKAAKEFEIASQFIKSGTSVGANVYEAQDAISKKDFILKLSISLKEANETRYWCKLIQHTELISHQDLHDVTHLVEENWRLLTRILTKLRELD